MCCHHIRGGLSEPFPSQKMILNQKTRKNQKLLAAYCRKNQVALAGLIIVLTCTSLQIVGANIVPIRFDEDTIYNRKLIKYDDVDKVRPPPPAQGPFGGSNKTPDPSSLGFVHAFVASISMIVVSELGDKTFFIAAIMAMRHARLVVFAGAMSALAFMTVLSALFGYATTVIPRIYTYYISTALFALFGFKMLYDGCLMSPDEGSEELEEVQASLRRREEADENTPMRRDLETSGISAKPTWSSKARRILFTCFSRIYLQSLTMTFLAEWGDRSQLATVVLAATENIGGVCIGGILGHSFCTGLAVLGGRMIAQKISVRTVTIAGGIVFLIFAVTSLFLNPNE